MKYLLTTEEFGYPMYAAPLRNGEIDFTDNIEEAELFGEEDALGSAKLPYYSGATGYKDLKFVTVRQSRRNSGKRFALGEPAAPSKPKDEECHKCGETIKGEEILPDFEQDKARAVEALVDTIGEEMLIDAFNLPKEAFDKKHQGKQRLSHDYLRKLATDHFGANGKLAEAIMKAKECGVFRVQLWDRIKDVVVQLEFDFAKDAAEFRSSVGKLWPEPMRFLSMYWHVWIPIISRPVVVPEATTDSPPAAGFEGFVSNRFNYSL